MSAKRKAEDDVQPLDCGADVPKEKKALCGDEAKIKELKKHEVYLHVWGATDQEGPVEIKANWYIMAHSCSREEFQLDMPESRIHLMNAVDKKPIADSAALRRVVENIHRPTSLSTFFGLEGLIHRFRWADFLAADDQIRLIADRAERLIPVTLDCATVTGLLDMARRLPRPSVELSGLLSAFTAINIAQIRNAIALLPRAVREPYLQLAFDIEFVAAYTAGPTHYVEKKDGPRVALDSYDYTGDALTWRDAHGDGTNKYDYKPHYRKCVNFTYKGRHGVELTDAKFKEIESYFYK